MKISEVDQKVAKTEEVMCDPCRVSLPQYPDRKLLGPGPVHIGVVEGDDGRGRYCKIITHHDGHLGAVELI